jgi:glycosyltransferase involved in cell wall biosynthesis/SAM-dependent methyltransferase
MYRIAFLMNGCKAPRGGELGLRNTVLALRQSGFDPTLFFVRQNSVVAELAETGCDCRRIETTGDLEHFHLEEMGLVTPLGLMRLARAAFSAARDLRSQLIETGIQILYCCDNFGKVIGWLATRKLPIKRVGQCHGAVEMRPLGLLLRVVNLTCLHRIFAVSEHVLRCFPRWSVRSGRVVLLRNSIDLVRFDPERVIAVPEAGIERARGRVVVGVVGVLDRNKGQEDVLLAASELRRHGIDNFSIWVIGEGYYGAKLQRLTATLGLFACVRFWGFRHDVPELLKGCDVLIVPTRRYESFGYVALEGMAMTLPVIATKIGGLEELVEHGVSGFLIQPGSGTDLVEGLRRLVADPDLRSQMGLAGRERARKHFGKETTEGELRGQLLSLASDAQEKQLHAPFSPSDSQFQVGNTVSHNPTTAAAPKPDASWEEHWSKRDVVDRHISRNNAYPDVVQVLECLTKTGDRCLEVGCGSGTYAIELAFRNRESIGLDESRAAVSIARKKAHNLYGQTLPLVQGDLFRLPFPDGTFDLIFSDGVVEHLDIGLALAAMAQKLRPGGWLVTKVPSGNLAYRIAYRALSSSENRPFEAWLRPDEWVKLAQSAGLRNVRLERCGSALRGMYKRLASTGRIARLLPNICRIHYLFYGQRV